MHDFAQQLECWEWHRQRAPFLVAVSGGVDSMALLHLAYEWAQAQDVECHAITVDHQLRPESAEEAQVVHRWCNERGIPHHTARWEHGGVASNIQATARKARYRLIENYCQANGLWRVLTGHHADDAIENFWLRMQHGAALENMGGIPAISKWGSMLLWRPLLSFSKAQLYDYARAHALPWAEDSSNQSPVYDRNAIRTHVFPPIQSATLQALQRLQARVEDPIIAYMARYVDISPTGMKAHYEAWRCLSPLIQVRVIQRLLQTCRGDDRRLRYGSVLPLVQKLGPAFRGATLHGCMIRLIGHHIVITHESRYRPCEQSLPSRMPLTQYFYNRPLK